MAVGRGTLYKQFDRALLVAIGFYGVFAYSTRHCTPPIWSPESWIRMVQDSEAPVESSAATSSVSGP
jgi:hypothetical protein